MKITFKDQKKPSTFSNIPLGTVVRVDGNYYMKVKKIETGNGGNEYEYVDLKTFELLELNDIGFEDDLCEAFEIETLPLVRI